MNESIKTDRVEKPNYGSLIFTSVAITIVVIITVVGFHVI